MDEVWKQKAESIFAKQQRTAVNMQTTPMNDEAQREFYSIHQTKQDVAEINELLQTNQMDVATQSETMNLSQDYVHRLQAIQNRNLSHILLNENKFGGDSEQMKNVKVSVEEVERLLSSQDENAGSLAYIEKLETAYRVAISHCQYYCDHKNPRFSTGIERKNAVLATLKYLRDEAAQLETVKKLVQEEGLDVEFANGKELLLLGRDMQDTIPESEKTVKKENFEISDLTYENFTQMIGTHNRGQVEFGKQGLKIINNGVFSRSKGEESAENLQIRRHFLDVARIKLGTRATLATLAQLTKDLGLEDVNQQTAKPLDRQTIKKIVSLINENTSEVTRHQESAKKYAENIDLSSAEYALTRDEFLASAVSRILGDETDAEDRISTPVEKETLLKAQIAAIIQEASSDFSEDFQAVKIPPLTKHQMDNLAKGNISLLRDNIFSSLQQLCMGMGHMNGGNPLRHAPIYSINHGHTIKTIAALNIRKMAAQTANERALAAQQLDTYIKEMSYKFYFMVSMSDSMPFTANEFEQLQVGAFISAGADGLEQEVEKRLPECKAWKSDQAKMNAGLNKLKVLCNQLHELSELREKAFREGLYDADAEQYKELGRNIQQALADEAGLAEMEFVATELKGTRFYTGMQEIKGRVQRAFDFEQASQKVATAMTCNGNHGERQPSENYRKVRDDYHEATQDEKLAKTLGKLNAKERNLAEILLAKKSASHSIGDDQSLLNGITQLYRKLKEMPRNEEALVEDISIGDTLLRLVKDENNSLSIVFNNLTISLPCHSVTLADHMEVDIVRNETIYGKELVQNILDGLTLQEDQVGEYSRGRQICLEYFGNKGIVASKLTNVPTTELISYAKHHQMGYLTNEGLFRMVDMIENAEHLNGSEVLNLIELMEAQKNQGLEEKVVISAQRQERRTLEEGAKWNAQEQPIVDLVSDLIFSKETWKAEKLLQNPAERMRMVLKTHSGALLAMILNPALFDNVVDKMPLPDAEEGQQGMKDIIKQGFRSFLQDEQLAQLRTVAATPVMGTFMAAAALTTALQSDEILNPLVELDAQISETVESSTAEIQRMVKAAIGKVFQEQDGQPVQQEQAVQPVQQEQTERKTMQQYRDERARLDQIIRESVSGQRGQGKFTKIILENYFTSVSMLDKRTMLASAIRNSRPSTVPADATEEQKKVMQTKAMGSYLSGLLKGAGPLLQKILQGMPLDSMPEELRTALKDMKSNLAPIPDTIVKAELWGIVERSKGNITKIELQRSLGAASVGEAFLCKMYGPQIPAEGKTVVVKLLRPDVRNRMMREKPILLACARQTDDGMEATYKGQLERIEEELDLTIEAKNVEKGGIYDAPFADVTSVKVNSMAEPTTNTLVLELAEGETVDRYMERTRSDYARLVTPLYRENETDTDVNTNPSTLNINSKNVKMVTEVREQLTQMLATLQKRQAHMINLARAWVTEGIYGAGFYHGDLHAGNIMINDEKLTVIDFGNATSLTRDQQTHIMRMMAAASAGKMELFREGFHALMKNTDENFYEQNKEALGDEIKRILHWVAQKMQRSVFLRH
ncbi:MAG: phosphotransferase [Eubacterium sp.]|nr:phosphotransferase [Eubacterium sp.]